MGLPAFLVPIAFVVTEPGEYLLGRGPAVGVLWVSAAACAGIAALYLAAGGWVLGVGAAGRDSASAGRRRGAAVVVPRSRHGSRRVWRVCSRRSHSPPSTGGDKNETYDDEVFLGQPDRHRRCRVGMRMTARRRRHPAARSPGRALGHPCGHRHRQRHRGVLLARQRLRGTDFGRQRRHGQGHRRRDGGVGSEHPATRRGHVSGGVLARRQRRRRGAGQG